jgi:hypothetical protein
MTPTDFGKHRRNREVSQGAEVLRKAGLIREITAAYFPFPESRQPAAAGRELL